MHGKVRAAAEAAKAQVLADRVARTMSVDDSEEKHTAAEDGRPHRVSSNNALQEVISSR